MKASDNYVKIVEWSEIDHCYIGSCLGLMYGGCHGDDEKEVFDEVCGLVEEIIEVYKTEYKKFPPATTGKFSEELLLNVA